MGVCRCGEVGIWRAIVTFFAAIGIIWVGLTLYFLLFYND